MSKKVLIIEDEPDIVYITKFRLNNAGYEVITAEDGRSGLDSVKSNKPDLILLDLNIPNLDGRELCKILKSDVELRHIPVIILTASSNRVDIEAEKIGADDYLIKPYDIENLLGKIKGIL